MSRGPLRGGLRPVLTDSRLTSAARSVYVPSMTGSRRCARHWRATPHPAEGPTLRALGCARTRRPGIDQERPGSRGSGPELKSEWSVKHRRGHKPTRQPTGCASKRSLPASVEFLGPETRNSTLACVPGHHTVSVSAHTAEVEALVPPPGVEVARQWRAHRRQPVLSAGVNGAGRGCQMGVRQDRPKAAAKRSP